MSAQAQRDLKIAYYGDDFTGATDTLATAARAGPLDCLGIAGAARAMTPAEMQLELTPVGELFAALQAPVVHYKTCSTFDSAPHMGSIGAAIQLLRPHVDNLFVPIVGGQPNLRRYCVFGNLFASAGPEIHRIDRHPTMRQHPVTPMHEADLRLHLAQQGLQQVSAIAYPDYAQDDEALERQLDTLLETETPAAVLFDIGDSTHLAPVGRLIWQQAQRQRLLAVGPSSVVQALAAHWQSSLDTQPATIAPADGPVLVLAGSLSPMTARQIKAASSYRQLPLDAARLCEDPAYLAQMAAQIAGLLRQGQHVLACTASDDSERQSARPARALAPACGELLAQVLEAAPLRRLGIAGGDTSSHAVQALQAWGLSYQAQLAPGVALCRLHSDQARLDGMELMLKGGQMGDESLFETLLRGTS